MATERNEHGPLYRALRAIQPLRCAVRAVRNFLGRYRPRVWWLEGTQSHTGLPLRIFFAGLLENKNYIASLAFTGGYSEVARGGMWLWSALRLARSYRADHDLAIIDMEVPLCRHPKEPRVFVVPNWVRAEVDLTVAAEQFKRSESVKSDLRKIRQHGYCYEVTKDEREFERFYHEMYMPYARQRYTGMMVLMTHADLKMFIPQSELLWVKSGAEDVAGLMLRYDGDVVRAYALGVKDGDPRYVQSGALAAAYYFAILYLKERGIQSLHLGGSRPFLRDGVLQYKKKWGIRIIDKSSRFFVLTWARNTKANMFFLANNPFFFETNDTLSGAIFNAREPGIPHEAIAMWSKEFVDLGISHVQIFDLTEDGELTRRGLPEAAAMVQQQAP